MLEKLDFAVNY